MEPELHVIQHHAPIPNDLDWYIIAGSIVFVASLLTHGVSTNVKRWHRFWMDQNRVQVFGEIGGIILAGIGGGRAGYLTWDWELGAWCGLTGGWAAPWVLEHVWILVTRLKWFRKKQPKPEPTPKEP